MSFPNYFSKIVFFVMCVFNKCFDREFLEGQEHFEVTFLLIQHSLGHSIPFTLFQSSSKVNTNNFYVLFDVSVKGWEFGASYSAILPMSLSSLLLTHRYQILGVVSAA